MERRSRSATAVAEGSSPEQSYELVPVGDLLEHPANPRRGDVDAIVASITSNGWHGALVVQRSTRFVLAGNHRLRAARALAMETVPVLWLDVDDDTAKRVLVADNRATDLGHFDEASLAALLVSADDLAGMLFSAADLALMGVTAVGDEVPTGAESGPHAASAPVTSRQPHHDDEGTVSLKPTVADREEDYRQSGLRSVVLPYPPETFLAVTDGLRALRLARSLTSNADVVAALVAEATAPT